MYIPLVITPSPLVYHIALINVVKESRSKSCSCVNVMVGNLKIKVHFHRLCDDLISLILER